MAIVEFAYPECEKCVYNDYDDESGEYVCDAVADEDEIARLAYRGNKACPFYKGGDEYMIVRKQI